MKERYFFLISLIICSLLIATFFWIEREREEVLKIGDGLPAMKYLTRDGLQILSTDSTTILLLMYFNRKCEHCRYQLDLFEKNIDLFRNQKFIFLTSEVKFLSEGKEKQWSMLSMQDNCSFGMVSTNEFLNAFGTISTPSIFIFNTRGLLQSKFNAEIKLDKLKQMSEIQK